MAVAGLHVLSAERKMEDNAASEGEVGGGPRQVVGLSITKRPDSPLLKSKREKLQHRGGVLQRRRQRLS